MRTRATVLLDFGSKDEDFELLSQVDQYIRLLGWSRKRMFLMGVAELLAKNGDNEDLLLQIIDYITKKR